MDFAWDAVKSDRNFAERGFGFDAAALIFEGPVIYTDRGDVRRIISARRARKKEIELWQWCVNL